MSQLDEKKRVLEQWLQLPESRRRDATDVVAFAYRLLQDRPELLMNGNQESSLDTIVSWLLPHLRSPNPESTGRSKESVPPVDDLDS